LAVSLTIGFYYLSSKKRKPFFRWSINVNSCGYNQSLLADKQLPT
jgi:hypothetical protein